MPTHNRDGDVSAMAFFNMAREYRHAASQLLDLNKGCSFSNPINFLYFHALELTLKAFLRSFDRPIVGTGRKSHKLSQLYEECQSLGLKIGSNDRVGIANIVSLLEAGNEEQGFRYFNLKSGPVPHLSWTREVVEGLMHAVEPRVGVLDKQGSAPAPPAKMTIIYGKPIPKR